MATFKALVFEHHKKSDGTYNVKIRVSHNRAVKYLSTTKFVTKADLTKGFRIKNIEISDDLDNLVKRYRDACNAYGEGLKLLSIEQVVDLISKPAPGSLTLDFVAYGKEQVNKLKAEGRIGTARGYDVALNSLVRFMGRDKIDVMEINSRLIQNWITWLGERSEGRAESLYPSAIRAVHNLAKRDYNDEDAGIVRIPLSPFKRAVIPRTPEPKSRALEIDQIRAIRDLPDTEIYQRGVNRCNLARDLFMLSFYLVGMNAVDLYNCTEYKDGRIIYNRTKTHRRRSDHAKISIKVEPEAIPLIEKYRDPAGKRVLCFHNSYSHDTFSTAIQEGVRQIRPFVGVDWLTFYAARHSWATIAANEAGVNKYTVHQALNHVDKAMEITDRYIRKDWSLIDKANRAVLDLL
jgi:hypothetical protein